MIRKHFIIDQVSWHTSTPGNTESRERIIRRFHAIARFLQEHELTIQPLMGNESDIQDGFAISTSDLTGEGLTLMKEAYDKWLRKADKGMDVENVTLLENALKRVRGK